MAPDRLRATPSGLIRTRVRSMLTAAPMCWDGIRVKSTGFGPSARDGRSGAVSGRGALGVGGIPVSLLAVPLGSFPVNPDAGPDPVPPRHGEERADVVHGRFHDAVQDQHVLQDPAQ